MAHIGKKSRFQTVCRLGFLLSLNQHGFRFLQFRDIIIDADQLNLPIFRLILVDHDIGTYPVPLILLMRPHLRSMKSGI